MLKARRLHLRAVQAWDRGERNVAVALAEQALRLLSISKAVKPSEITDRVNVLLTLARFASDLTDHNEADRRLATAVGLLRDVPPSRDRAIWLSEALVRLGDTARLAGRYPDAARFLTEACDIVDTEDLDPIRKGGVRNLQGILAKDTGRYADAGTHYAAALALLEPFLGPDSPQLASLHHNLAGLAHAQGDYLAAEPPARRALQLRRQIKPPDKAGLAGDIGVLGAVLVGQGRCDEAERALHEALTLWENLYGPAHYEIAVTLHNLAAIAQARGDLATAETSLQRAIVIKTDRLGADHPEVTDLKQRLTSLVR